MEKLNEEEIDGVKKILGNLKKNIDILEKGLTDEDVLNNYRAFDAIIALSKASALIFEIQRDSIIHTLRRFDLKITEVH